MFRIDTSTALSSLPSIAPAGSPGYFTEGDAATGIPATVVSKDFLNGLQEELMSILAAADIQAAKGKNNQVLAAINSLLVKQGSSDGSLSTGDQAYIGLRTGITSGAARIGAKIDDTDFGNFAMSGNGTLGMGSWTEEYYTLSSGGSRTISLTFNAPLDGYVLVIGSANYAAQNTNQTNLTISVNGTSLSADQVTGSTSMTNHSCVKVSAGTVTVGSYCGTSATNPPNVGHTLSYIYIPA